MSRGQGWTPLYMLIVIIIAAVLIYTLVKPVLRASASAATENLEEARRVAGALFLSISIAKLKRGL